MTTPSQRAPLPAGDLTPITGAAGRRNAAALLQCAAADGFGPGSGRVRPAKRVFPGLLLLAFFFAGGGRHA